jgi:hypothetical protein
MGYPLMSLSAPGIATLDPQNCLTAKSKRSNEFLRDPRVTLSFFDFFDFEVNILLPALRPPHTV